MSYGGVYESVRPVEGGGVSSRKRGCDDNAMEWRGHKTGRGPRRLRYDGDIYIYTEIDLIERATCVGARTYDIIRWASARRRKRSGGVKVIAPR